MPSPDIPSRPDTTPGLWQFTVSGTYDNASFEQDGTVTEIEPGDVCVANIGAPYGDGDLVVVKCSCPKGSATHYHTKVFHKFNGTKFSFRFSSRFGKEGKRYRDDDRGMIRGLVVKVVSKTKPTDSPRRKPAGDVHVAAFDWSAFGIHQDDRLTVERTGKAAIGQVVLVKAGPNEKDPQETFCRVCDVKDSHMRIAGERGAAEDIPHSRIIGPVVSIDHKHCEPTKIAALRAQLAALRNGNDPISHTTHCFEIEKEVYALEHPPEPAEEEKWPDIIGE